MTIRRSIACGSGSYLPERVLTNDDLAAMVDNPADLVQPRSETPAYTSRRSAGFDKYRKGNSTATIYPESDNAKLSSTGK